MDKNRQQQEIMDENKTSKQLDNNWKNENLN